MFRWPWQPCPHTKLVTACITCGRQPGHHNIGCLCQDFRTNVCARCKTLVWPPR